jgi:hypothetical protein
MGLVGRTSEVQLFSTSPTANPVGLTKRSVEMTALIEQLASEKLDKGTVAAAYAIGILVALAVLSFFGVSLV